MIRKEWWHGNPDALGEAESVADRLAINHPTVRRYLARSTNLLFRVDFHPNIEAHERTEMITRPHSVDGLVKGKLGGFDVAVRVRSVSAPHEASRPPEIAE